MNNNSFKTIVKKLSEGKILSMEEFNISFNLIMSGEVTNSQIGAFLMSLKLIGENSDSIASGASTMRKFAKTIKSNDFAVDTVGTGGDGLNTLNISSAVAFVVAGCGVPVAKHGNRSLSSKSGAADVLSELGVNLDCSFKIIQKSFDEIGICFLMAPNHHTAMKHVGPARVELGIRTIFNLLGPLSNPALVKRQLVGVFDKKWLLPFAEALKLMGSTHSWVVHGKDGLDEVSTTGKTYVAELKNNKISQYEISPEDYGIPICKIDDLKGGSPQENSLRMLEMLKGEKGPYRDIVILNSACTLFATGHENSIQEGIAKSINSIDNGKALNKLNSLIKISNIND